jgi:hypothetical protein
VSGALAVLWGLPEYAGYSAVQLKQLLLSKARRVPVLAGKSVTEGVLDLSFLAAAGVASVPAEPQNAFRNVEQGTLRIDHRNDGDVVDLNGKSIEKLNDKNLSSVLRSLVGERVSIQVK